MLIGLVNVGKWGVHLIKKSDMETCTLCVWRMKWKTQLIAL